MSHTDRRDFLRTTTAAAVALAAPRFLRARNANDKLNLAVIGGDGIGPEVVAEGLNSLEAATAGSGLKVSTTEYDLGARRWHATGETLPFPYHDPRFGLPRRDDLYFNVLERDLA